MKKFFSNLFLRWAGRDELPMGRNESGQRDMKEFVLATFGSNSDALIYLFSKLIAPKMVQSNLGGAATKYQRFMVSFNKLHLNYSQAHLKKTFNCPEMRAIFKFFLTSPQLDEFVRSDPTLSRRPEAYLKF